MIEINWHPLKDELQFWQDAELTLPFWWRDDDAIEPTPALSRLVAISTDLNLPLHLAVIPKYATSTLGKQLSSTNLIIPVVHGWAHVSHAPEGQKNAEFGTPRSIEDCAHDAISGLHSMIDLFGDKLKPMFVPPWNRINPDLGEHLVAIGYDTISTYAPRKTQYAVPNLEQINTHLDPIAWHQGRSLIAPETLVEQIVKLMQDRRLGHTDNTEPLGFLTHHLVHDEAIWDFTEQFLTIMRTGPIRAFR
jgi:hypothetical protein